MFPHRKPSSSSSTHALKRNSTQAALDFSPEQGPSISSSIHERRLIAPVPKRPRLTSTRRMTASAMSIDDWLDDVDPSHPAEAHPRASVGASSAPNAAVAGPSNKRRPLQTGITIFLDSMDVSVDVDQDIDDEEKDGPSKVRHHHHGRTNNPFVSSSSSSSSLRQGQAGPSAGSLAGPSRSPLARQESTVRMTARRPSAAPVKAEPRDPSSPWDVFASDDGNHGSLDFTVGSSPPAYLPTDSEDEEGPSAGKGKARSYVFRGRKVQRASD